MTLFASRYPVARIDDLVTTDVGDEVLVFDEISNELHHLNPIASQVWRSLDGTRSPADIAALLDPADATIENVTNALGILAQANLLVQGEPWQSFTQTPLSRRKLTKGAIVTATIVSITAPTAAAASTPGTSICIEMNIDPPVNGGCSSNVPCCPDSREIVPNCVKGICMS